MYSQELTDKRKSIPPWANLFLTAIFCAACTAPEVVATSTPFPIGIDNFNYGNFTPDVNNYNLVPKPLDNLLYTSPEGKLSSALAYLELLRNALEDFNLSDASMPLSKLDMTVGNFPVAIPWGGDAGDWDVVNVYTHMLAEINSNKVRVVYDDSYTKLAGTRNNFKYDEESGRWVRNDSVITFGSKITKDTLYFETDQLYYRWSTDAELAGILIHEYFHVLQGEMLNNLINNDPKLLEEIHGDPKLFDLVMERLVTEWNERISNQVGLSETVNTNEAQANAAEFYYIYLLEKINGGQRFPGVRLQDPLEFQVQELRAQVPDFMNLTNVFKTSVIGTGSALDPTWIRLAGK